MGRFEKAVLSLFTKRTSVSEIVRSSGDFSLVRLAGEALRGVPWAPGQKLQVLSGQRTMTLSFKELDEYLGARATRGGLLPRGWQKVDGLAVE